MRRPHAAAILHMRHFFSAAVLAGIAGAAIVTMPTATAQAERPAVSKATIAAEAAANNAAHGVLSPLTPEAQAQVQAQEAAEAPQPASQPAPQSSASQSAPPSALPPVRSPAATAAAARSLLVPERTPPVRPAVSLPAAQTIADQRLQRIYDSQQEFFAELAQSPQMAESIRDQRVQNLINQYQSLLLDNPEYVYGYILYGKLLRQVGQRELANMAFVKANGLDPNIAVIKQQIGNYLSEEGEYGLALPYYLAAVQLEPQVALYHYQVGELLHTYRDAFTAEGELAPHTLEQQMQAAFANAARLEPQTRVYPQRYAESFFDVAQPDWRLALVQWEALEQSAADALQQQIARLQKTRVLIALGRYEQAQAALNSIDEAPLADAKAILQTQLNTAGNDGSRNSTGAITNGNSTASDANGDNNANSNDGKSPHR